MVNFSAPLVVNCSQSFGNRSIFLPSSVANISCVSNQLGSLVAVDECVLDQEIPLENCKLALRLTITHIKLVQ